MDWRKIYLFKYRCGSFLVGLRFLDPIIGRFINRDILGFYRSSNIYSYTDNNTLVRIDAYALSWRDWVPIVRTVANIIITQNRSYAEDYLSCHVTKADCMDLGSEAAKTKCINCIDSLLLKYMVNYIGPGSGRSGIQSLSSAIICKLGQRPSTGWVPIAGGVLAIDGIINAGVTISKTVGMLSAANQAKKMYCNCPDDQQV